jgi:hypothetical protein
MTDPLFPVDTDDDVAADPDDVNADSVGEHDDDIEDAGHLPDSTIEGAPTP